eukprot:scaffold4145_cov115-Isochrysis_galbana.AAC.11
MLASPCHSSIFMCSHDSATAARSARSSRGARSPAGLQAAGADGSPTSPLAAPASPHENRAAEASATKSAIALSSGGWPTPAAIEPTAEPSESRIGRSRGQEGRMATAINSHPVESACSKASCTRAKLCSP